MLRLEKIDGKNVWDISKFRVSDGQKNFVASNDISIIKVYAMTNGNGYAFSFAVYNAGIPMGFLMIGFGVNDCWNGAPKVAQGNYNLWRLMIDRSYQGKGFGRKATQFALNFIRAPPCGAVGYYWLSYESENDVVCQLYSSSGFVETGDKDGEEIIAALKL